MSQPMSTPINAMAAPSTTANPPISILSIESRERKHRKRRGSVRELKPRRSELSSRCRRLRAGLHRVHAFFRPLHELVVKPDPDGDAEDKPEQTAHCVSISAYLRSSSSSSMVTYMDCKYALMPVRPDTSHM